MSQVPDWDEVPWPWTPTPGEQGTAIALYNASVCGDRDEFERVLLDYCGDILRDQNIDRSVVALVAYGAGSLTAHQGEALTAARIRQDLSVARQQALEES